MNLQDRLSRKKAVYQTMRKAEPRHGHHWKSRPKFGEWTFPSARRCAAKAAARSSSLSIVRIGDVAIPLNPPGVDMHAKNHAASQDHWIGFTVTEDELPQMPA